MVDEIDAEIRATAALVATLRNVATQRTGVLRTSYIERAAWLADLADTLRQIRDHIATEGMNGRDDDVIALLGAMARHRAEHARHLRKFQRA